MIFSRIFLKVFTIIIWRGGHLGHVILTISNFYLFPFPGWLCIQFGFDWLSGFSEKDLWDWWLCAWKKARGRDRQPPGVTALGAHEVLLLFKLYEKIKD